MPNLQTGLLVVFLFLLHGCVVIPLPEKCVSGEEVTPEELAVLQPSLTSKKEIIELLGEPDVFWVDENVFVYNWSMRWAVMPWIVGGPYQAVGGIEEFENDYVLLLQFDKDDLLQRCLKSGSIRITGRPARKHKKRVRMIEPCYAPRVFTI